MVDVLRELAPDEYEIEAIIEYVKGSKPFKWLVKWAGWDLDRDASWSYVHRKDMTTDSANEMLLEFERNRHSAAGKEKTAKKRPASAPPKSPPAKRGRGRGRARGRGHQSARGRGRGRIALDSSDEEEAANEFEFEFDEEALDYADPE